MSDRGSFLGGFLFGTIVGGVIGGVVGAVATAHVAKRQDEPDEPDAVSLLVTTEEEMEVARRGVEDKIAQLNHAIDDVRHQLGAIPRATAVTPPSTRDHETE